MKARNPIILAVTYRGGYIACGTHGQTVLDMRYYVAAGAMGVHSMLPVVNDNGVTS